MSDAADLLAAFDAGELLRPDAAEPNLVDLARAIASAAGVDGIEQTPGVRTVGAHIGNPEHLVFVVADGLGVNLLERLPPQAFLRRRLAMELRTVFPSTTAVALTTLATGEWPARHGITGWWTYLREVDGAVTVVRFERRMGQKPLGELDVAPEALIVEVTGTKDKVEALIEMLRTYGIKELVRTGRVAMTRGADTPMALDGGKTPPHRYRPAGEGKPKVGSLL